MSKLRRSVGRAPLVERLTQSGIYCLIVPLQPPYQTMRLARMTNHAVRGFLSLTLLLSALYEARAERLPIKTYTSADGLGSSFLNDLMRDSRGFMWFCTRDGLSRFDGARFVTYHVGNRNAPPGIESITETRDGSYWITTTGGLYRFKRDAVSQPNAANSSSPTLNAEYIDFRRGHLLEDRNGNLWYGGGRLFHVEEKDGTVSFQEVDLNLPVPENRGPGVIGMREARDGSLWLDTTVGLVRRLPDGRVIFYPIETNSTMSDRMCLVDENQRVWYVLGLALYVLQPEPLESLSHLGRVTVRTLKPTYVLPANTEKEIHLPEKAGEILLFTAGDFLSRYRAHRLCQTSDKHIWLTTDRELIEFDGRVFHRFTAAQGLPPGMSTLAEDSGGNLWISGPAVLVRLDRRGMTSYGDADRFHSPSIHAISEAKDGILYFADGDYYLTHFAGKSLETERPAVPHDAKFLWTSRFAFLDSRNEWWILTDKRLYRFSRSNLDKPLASYTTRDGLKADAVFQIYEDKRGDIWVSLQPTNPNKGLGRFERSRNRFYTFSEAEGFPPGKSVSSFAEDNHGNLWLGFYEGGLARYADNRFTQFGTADGVPEGVLTDLQVDRKGRLWMGATTGGVSRIDDPGAEQPSFDSLTTNNGLSSNNIRTITEDKLGNIYLGTVRGVDRISPEANHIKHYSVSDGLAGDFVVDSRCDKNGVVWFATTNGLSRLVPTADESHPPPAIWLGGLRISGIPQALSELGENKIAVIELSPTQNNLQMDYFGLDFHAGETLRYQYRLEGADTDWSAPTEQRSVTFGNLRPGTYRFLVRALDSHGASSEEPATASFKILPRIWQSWWFIALSSMLVGTIALAIMRQRAARRREREQVLRQARDDRLRDLEEVRRRIAMDLHDDIGSSLTQISILSEVMRQRVGRHDSPVNEPLSMIATSSRELVDSMSDIVWAINPQKDHLSDLVQRMRRFASDVFTARDIDFELRLPGTDRDIKLEANLRREVFLIFKESINNMVRHSRCTTADIELELTAEFLLLTLSDDGKGFDASRQGEGHGLISMRERAGHIGGKFELVSSDGEGTTVTLKVPLGSGTRPTARGTDYANA